MTGRGFPEFFTSFYLPAPDKAGQNSTSGHRRPHYIGDV
jgi:hypothetical protein